MSRRRRPVIALLVLCAILPPSTEAIASVSFQELVKLTASNASSVDDFGNAVAVDGNTAVVAAWTADGATSLSGAVYVFTRNHGGSDAWDEVEFLTLVIQAIVEPG